MLAVYVGNLVQEAWGLDMLLEAIPYVAKSLPQFSRDNSR